MNGLKKENKTEPSLNLRVGEWVEVRSAEEILATLDDLQSVDSLPFMPEMLRYCGKQFRIGASAHKTADTIELYTIRRMTNTVHLEELRCDGSAHGGCQAGCLLFWKESWLIRVQREPSDLRNPDRKDAARSDSESCPVNPDVLDRGTRCLDANGEVERYRCQATEMLRATTEVRRRDRFDPRFYARDLTSGNVKLFDFVRFGVLAMLNSFFLRWFNCRYPFVRGLAGEKTPTLELNLQPGEWVRVRSKREIMQTLNRQMKNRGMWFDVEMALYCRKGLYQVLRRVEQIINEKTGEMMKLKYPCIILKGVTCSGNYLSQRMFSRRREYMYFREIWLERVAEATAFNRSMGEFGASFVRLAHLFGADLAVASKIIAQISRLRFVKLVEQSSRAAVVTMVLLFVVCIGFVDYITGFEASVSILYLLAIGTAAWFVGRVFAIFVAILSVGVSLYADVAGGAHFSSLFVPAWNTINHISLYLVMVWVIAALHSLQRAVETRLDGARQL